MRSKFTYRVAGRANREPKLFVTAKKRGDRDLAAELHRLAGLIYAASARETWRVIVLPHCGLFLAVSAEGARGRKEVDRAIDLLREIAAAARSAK